MKIKTLVLSVLTVFALTSCINNKKSSNDKIVNETVENQLNEEEIIDSAHNSQNSLDWAGTYKGVLPCADCPGIETELVLNDDDTFTLRMKYLERDTQVNQEGDISWTSDGNHISLNPKDEKMVPLFFKVGENRLFQMDEEGNVVEGELADQYILEKEIQVEEADEK